MSIGRAGSDAVRHQQLTVIDATLDWPAAEESLHRLPARRAVPPFVVC